MTLWKKQNKNDRNHISGGGVRGRGEGIDYKWEHGNYVCSWKHSVQWLWYYDLYKIRTVQLNRADCTVYKLYLNKPDFKKKTLYNEGKFSLENTNNH